MKQDILKSLIGNVLLLTVIYVKEYNNRKTIIINIFPGISV